MIATVNQDVLSALEQLTPEAIDRLRLKLRKRFGEFLRKIPDAPDPDELLHETIVDLLEGIRHCPLDHAGLPVYLFNIVRSKTSHLYEKWKKERIVKESEAILERENNQMEAADAPNLYHKIMAMVADDVILRQIVEYRLTHPEEEPIKAQKIADQLGYDLKEVYNANRRLKTRLEPLVTKAAASRCVSAEYKGEMTYVG